MTTAAFLWEGDEEEPGTLIRLEGEGPGPSDAEVRESLEAEVPRFQDLLALELAVHRSSGRWTALWLLVSRSQEDRLHRHLDSWSLVIAGLVPLTQGTVAVAPEGPGGLWTVAVKAQGQVQGIRRISEGDLVPPVSGPLWLVVPGPGQPPRLEGGLRPIRILTRNAVITPAVAKSLNRQLQSAADKDFPVVRLARNPASGALVTAAGLILLAAVNLAAFSSDTPADPGPEPAPVLPLRTVIPPRPSAVLEALALPGFELEEFRMAGTAWRLEVRTQDGLTVLEALRTKAPRLRVVQFQNEGGRTKILVEGEGYP